MVWAIGGPQWRLVDEGTAGAVAVVDDPLPAPGTYRTTGWVLHDVAGVPHRQFTWTEWSREQAVELKLAQIEAKADEQLAAGFPCTIQGNAEHLQTRDADDKANWLATMFACQGKIAIGQGDQPCPLPIRTTSNTTYALTASDAFTLVEAGQAWVAGTMKRSWDLKDAVATVAASSDDDIQPALDAIDITAGWP